MVFVSKCASRSSSQQPQPEERRRRRPTRLNTMSGLPVPDHTDDVDEEIRRVRLAIDAVFSSPQRIAPSMIPPTGGIKDSWPIVT